MPNGAAQERHLAQRAAGRLLYGVEERPRAWEALLYGWQHTLVDISPFVLPLAVATGLGFDARETAQLISYGLLAMGLATLLQTTLGNRLPIIQGPSATLIGVLAPLASSVGAPALWGGVFVGGLLEASLGGMRLVGRLRRFFPPVVSGTVVVVIGLSLGQLAVRLCLGAGRWVDFLFAVAVVTCVLVLQLSARRFLGGLLSRAAIFVSIWLVGLGLGSVLGEVNWKLVHESAWLSVPTLLPYGGPGLGWSFSLSVILVVFAAYCGSMVESLGDYAATCEVVEVEYTQRHMNRGIFAEGLGSALVSLIGGLPCTSYTQNIGILATTRVGSRFVVQLAGTVLLLYGLCPKFGALLVAMPRPVLGGVFVLVCGSIVVAGVRLLGTSGAAPQKEEPTARDGHPRRELVAGTTLVVSLALPVAVQSVLGSEWLAARPLALSLLLTNSVVLAVLIGVLLQAVVGEREPGYAAAGAG